MNEVKLNDYLCGYTLIKIKEMLKEYIKAKGVKQKWIADKIGISEVTLSNWVKMKTTPSDENMEKLSKVLNMNVSDIIKLYGR